MFANKFFGIDVNEEQCANVATNMYLILVNVAILENNVSGIDANDEQYSKVPINSSSALFVTVENNPAGIDTNDVQLSKVCENTLYAPPVIPKNKFSGIEANDSQCKNVCPNILFVAPITPLNNVSGILVIFVFAKVARNVGCLFAVAPSVGKICPIEPEIATINEGVDAVALL